MSTPTLLAVAATLGLVTTPAFTPAGDPPPARPIDLAICLDTSGSMKGLIDSARHSIWAIVNDLALSKPTPKLRIALLTFGNTGHPAEAGWVHLDAPLTDDLDVVSEKLFALTTNGGDEYVGRVLQASLDQLSWSSAKDALKIIVVAGNESADQDQTVSFRDMCKRAISSDIIVNSIYCGNPADDLAPAWREVATLADGQFAAIDKDHASVAIATPFDEQMTALSAGLNGTYLRYGERGESGASNQIRQDGNATKLNGAVAATRALAKCTTSYTNPSWDLVDACRNVTFKIEDVAEKDLPEDMRKMTPEQRKQHIAAMEKKRGEIQKQITALHTKRQVYIVEQQQKNAFDASKSFDHAVRQAMRAQAEARGQRYQQPLPQTPPEAKPPVSGPPVSGPPIRR